MTGNFFWIFLVFFVSGFFFPLKSLSQTNGDGILSSVNVGFRYSSVLVKKGAVFYNDFQLDPVLGLFFFDDRLEFLGDSLGYRDFVLDDRIRLRTRVQAISDDPLFPSHESIRSSVNRSDSYEWINSIEIFTPGYNDSYQGQFDINFAKEILNHKGYYLEVLAKVKLFNFNLFRTKIEPNLALSYGAGDLDHNAYFYGPNNQNWGVANSTAGLWFAFPEEADRFYPIIQIIRYSTHGLQNNSQGYLFSFIATMGLFE